MPLATTAVENALVTSRHFTGPIALGALALALEDPGEQDRILEQGRDVLAEGCVGHCYFFFHGDAIAILLERGDWESADRHAGALEAFTRAEPLGLIDFTIRQARLLAEAGRRGNEASLGAEFEALVRDARAMGIANTLTGLLDLPYRPGDTTSPGTIRSNRGNEGGNTWAKI